MSVLSYVRKIIGLRKKERDRARRKLSIDKNEDKFHELLFKIHTSRDRVEKYYLIKEAKKYASKVPSLKGWPSGSKLWDLEAGMWKINIHKEVRNFLVKELRGFSKGKNLSLGCGNCPYVKGSILVDYSSKMIESAPKGYECVVFDIDKKVKLPFSDSSFDSCTMVFVTNYLSNLKFLFKDIKRVLKKKGKLVVVNYDGVVSELYSEQEKNHLLGEDLAELMGRFGFMTKVYTKKVGEVGLVFVEGRL